MTEISIEKLPGIPRIWLDYAAGLKSPVLPEPFGLDSLKVHAHGIASSFSKTLDLAALAEQGQLLGSAEGLDSIRRLQSADSVAVVTAVYPSLFGGPASQIWKCLMAIKACEEMSRRGISAVPVGFLSLRARSDIPRSSIEILDAESELRSLSLLPAQRVALINEIRKLGSGSFDEVALGLIADAHPAGDNFSSATLRLLSSVLKNWGMLFLDMPTVAATYADALPAVQSDIEEIRDRQSSLAGAGYLGESEGALPESLLCSLVLPSVAHVVDPHELFAFCCALPVFNKLGVRSPLAWPCSGVTLEDTRSRRTLEKYNLQISDLFSGELGVIERLLSSAAADSVLAKLDGFKADVEQTLSQVHGQADRDDIERYKKSCGEKVLYQVQNLRRRFESARREREEALSRQIHRACNLLAPQGRPQESEISGIYFLLRYTQNVLQSVLDRLNAFTFQHQLISME